MMAAPTGVGAEAWAAAGGGAEVSAPGISQRAGCAAETGNGPEPRSIVVAIPRASVTLTVFAGCVRSSCRLPVLLEIILSVAPTPRSGRAVAEGRAGIGRIVSSRAAIVAGDGC